jgi:hypothetical protein
VTGSIAADVTAAGTDVAKASANRETRPQRAQHRRVRCPPEESIVFKQAAILGVCVTAFSGCALEAENPDQGEVFTETVVVLGQDGHETTYIRELTPEEAAMTERRAPSARDVDGSAAGDRVGESAQALTKDPTCAGSSLWLQDQQNQSGNRICFHNFYGGWTVDLASYCRVWVVNPFPYEKTCISYWNAWVASFWAGDFQGKFMTQPAGGSEYWYSSWERQDAPSNPAILNARYVYAPPLVK